MTQPYKTQGRPQEIIAQVVARGNKSDTIDGIFLSNLWADFQRLQAEKGMLEAALLAIMKVIDPANDVDVRTAWDAIQQAECALEFEYQYPEDKEEGNEP